MLLSVQGHRACCCCNTEIHKKLLRTSSFEPQLCEYHFHKVEYWYLWAGDFYLLSGTCKPFDVVVVRIREHRPGLVRWGRGSPSGARRTRWGTNNRADRAMLRGHLSRGWLAWLVAAHGCIGQHGWVPPVKMISERQGQTDREEERDQEHGGGCLGPCIGSIERATGSPTKTCRHTN